jgi:hypothetical protein
MFLNYIGFLAAIFVVCAFAQNPAPTAPIIAPAPVAVPPAEVIAAPEAAAVPPAEVIAAPEAAAVPPTEVIAAPEAAADSTVAAPAETVAAPEPAAPIVPAPEAPAAPPAKEAIIENPIEFAIVCSIFIATALLIALTGN